jgi:hypothetical protein
MRKTLKQIFAEYGKIAVVVYLALFFVVLVGAWFGIRLGWAPSGVAGNAGTWTAAYIVTKITQPLRIAATVVLTTFIGRLWDRRDASTADGDSTPVDPPKSEAP